MAFVVLLLTLVLSMTAGCPTEEDISPCVCNWPANAGSAYITCSKLDNEQDLVKAAASLAGRNYIYSFVIEDSVLNFVPSDAFKGLKFKELEIKDTSFMALTDTDVAFEGLEDHLEILLMTNFTMMNEWDWSIFKNLRRLTRLDIIEGNLESVEDLGKINISSIHDIGFAHNRISFIHPSAFSSFTDLSFLSLADNEIEEVTRGMFPNPASELRDLDLSSNRIEQFPVDIFTNMPTLEFLSVANNKILVLNEDTFSPVWESLEGFSAMGNDLRCDCRMAWILTKKFPESVRAVCSHPPEVKGTNINGLASKDLFCMK